MQKAIIKYLPVILLFGLILFSSCEKKLDKVLTIDEGVWLANVTTTVIEHDYSDHEEHRYAMYRIRFDKDGTGKKGAEVLDTDFTWKLKKEELQLSFDYNVLPYKLTSRSTEKMVWEKSYKANGDFATVIIKLELIRL